MTNASSKSWRDVLSQPALGFESAFGEDFLARYGNRIWHPTDADQRAAHSFHIELLSRIATQPLGYSEGVEERALTSVFELFGRARAITEANPEGTTFETVVWYLMNSSVRPFTAKWHPKSAAGVLKALDSSDVFRTELAEVQERLVVLDTVLQTIRGEDGLSVRDHFRPADAAIDTEMNRSVGWRPMGEIRKQQLSKLGRDEDRGVLERRQFYNIDLERQWTAGIALSGGGIRSATFAIGVLASLARRNLLQQFDYLSTVSGGGYAGAFLTQLLGTPTVGGNIGLRSTELPFKRVEGESPMLRRIRQSSRYLSGSLYERFAVAMAQAHGVFINILVIAFLACLVGYVDFILRSQIPNDISRNVAFFSPFALAALFLLIPIYRSWFGYPRDGADKRMAIIGIVFLFPPLWFALGILHGLWQSAIDLTPRAYDVMNADVSGIVTVIVSAAALGGALFATFGRLRPILLVGGTALLFLLAETLVFQSMSMLGMIWSTVVMILLTLLAVYFWNELDVNSTSLHRYYRSKLAAAFLIDSSLEAATPIKLSAFNFTRALFPIFNCALNVPGSKAPAMRGRNADLFAFTPVSAGANLIGHSSIAEWEGANPDLDLATAMALSGAAISPQMGLRTTRYASFWLTVLNLRLGTWLRKPSKQRLGGRAPGVSNLVKELTATADENGPYLHISDGGHIENLGVYELLRRRCRYIVAVDGESDPRMTFHALTNLQRLAYIDFGITIEAELDDLRLGDRGFSRSHFRFCRIRYPLGAEDAQEEIGYLVYLKLSLTGNEGEFIRRFKLDEPAFPHHSTADQFFSEPQFEAYRALGEHIGDKMFLPAITGRLDAYQVDLEQWFSRLGRSFLDPLMERFASSVRGAGQ